MSAGAVAVAGCGVAGYGRFLDESVASIASRAVTAALDDCGLERSDIDGLFVHIGNPRGLDYDEVAKLLGLQITLAAQPWSHGRFGATVIGNAWMALKLGLVDCALCLAAWKPAAARGGTRESSIFDETLREGGGPHAEAPHAGAVAPVFGAALATRAYFDRYAVDPEKLGAVALSQRRSALRNPLALMHKEMTAADYAAARPIVEPLRLFDCSVPSGAGVALLLTREDRARGLRQAPIFIRGFQGIHAGPDEFIFGQPNLGVGTASAGQAYVPLGPDEPVYRQAGIAPSDVDLLGCYDGFSPQVLWTLERFGFCDVGEGAEWVQDGRIDIEGALPVNTSGGQLSEGHTNGWGATAEIVAQLRGQAGERQVAAAAVGQWATTLGDSIIYATSPN
jgi:acetyl-CoA acetyltransferase